MLNSALKKTVFYSISLFSIHFILCLLFFKSFPLITVGIIHLFYFISLFLACYYVINQYNKSEDKLWIAYLLVVTIKFFISLGFVYLVKEVYKIGKIQALVHLFIWFFAYLLIEVLLIVNSIRSKRHKKCQ